MKFIVKLIANFLGAVITSSKKLLTHHKLNFVDEQLYLPQDGAQSDSGDGKKTMTLEEELQSKILHEEELLAREIMGGAGASEEDSKSPASPPKTSSTDNRDKSAGLLGPPDSSKGRKKKDKKSSGTTPTSTPAKKPRVGKAAWGLPTLRVRDSDGGIIEINSEKPVEVETEYFKGTILIMLRTDGDLEEFNGYEHHFAGKQRKFEVQFQGNMKNVPQGEVMLGGELQEKMDISFVTRALLSVITKFCMSLNPFLHFGFGETPKDDGMYELPHLTFPLFRVMDRVIVTPPGGELPQLGRELVEDEQQRKDRRAGRGDALSFKADHTYSFSFHSMYVDFSRWAICNFPGYKAIDIRGFFGQQHINVVCYEISEKDLMATGKAQHYNAHKRYLLTLEMKHVLCMSPEELAEAELEEEAPEEGAGGVSESEAASNDSHDDRDDDSEGDGGTTSDCEEGRRRFDGDDMDEESLAIAREMRDDHHQFDELESSGESGDGPFGEASSELQHVPDESELIPGDTVVSLIAIPAPWEPWEQELSELECDLEQLGGPDFDLDIDPHDGLSALRPAMSRSERSCLMHGNATTHEDAGLSPKRTCFGIADLGGAAVRKECSSLPAVRFIPVTPPHISPSRLARMTLRRNVDNNDTTSNASAAAAPTSPPRRRGMLSALYPRRRTTSLAEKHSTITPDTTAAIDQDVHRLTGLRCGDAVQIQSATTNRFLSVRKGWWLGWDNEEYIPSSSAKNNRIASKVLFTIHPTDSTGLKYLPQGTLLVAGMPFRLRSVRWPDWEMGCCEPGRAATGDRHSAVVLYYAKIKVRHHVPTTGPVKWHNSSKKVNPLCLAVMHEEGAVGGGSDAGRRRSMSSGSDVGASPVHHAHSVAGSTGFEGHGGPHGGPKRIFSVCATRVVQSAGGATDITGISSGKDDASSSVSTASILTHFLAPLEAGAAPLHDLTVTVSGWAEVLNRSLNYAQLAYIVTVSYRTSSDVNAKLIKWTTLRTQEDLDEIFSQIEDESLAVNREDDDDDEPRSVSHSDRNSLASNSDGETGYGSSDAKARIGGGGAGATGSVPVGSPSAKDQWSVVDRDDEEDRAVRKVSVRRGGGGVGGEEETASAAATSSSTGGTPSRLQRAKRSVLRRSRVNIQKDDIAPNHLYPADQNVLIMTNRITKAFSPNTGVLDSPDKSKFGSSDSLQSFEGDMGAQHSRGQRRASRDDGSGTRVSLSKSESSESARKHQSLRLEGGQLAALKGNLSDNSASPPLEPGSSSPSSVTPELSMSPSAPAGLAALTASSSSSDRDRGCSPSAQLAKRTFLAALSAPQILDTWFLSEDGDKYLRAPPPSKKAPPRQHMAIVARALWDTHWREEIAVVYPSYIAFYPLLAKKASWTLHLQELIGISHVADSTSPLPGFSVLRIETIGRLHYLAFSSKESCNIMAASVLEHFSEITFDSSMPLARDMGDPRDRFVLKSGRWRPAGKRLILNARKFLFDVEDREGGSPGGSSSVTASLDFSERSREPYWRFAERLLQNVFRLELDSAGDSEGQFPGRDLVIKFLDETVELKQINLQRDVVFSSPEALCFFTNIYHTLLMHARLVLGPPGIQDWASFFDTVCYEIGSDVFSLCEIEHCVLGGRLARPLTTPRSFAPPPRANDDHYLYALPAADRRMRFLVNYGSLSLLPTIYLMTPEAMHHSLNEASVAFFESSMVVDMKKRTVTLPKICDTFGLDFGVDPLAVLRHILRYLNRDNWEKVSTLLTGAKAPTVKFQDLKPRSHSRLHLVIQK